MEKDWIIVFETSLSHQAEIARDLLEAEDIVAVIINKRDSSYTAFGELEVYVHESNRTKALEILKELRD